MKNKKEQILDVSFSLFLEKGYDYTSISDILKKLDIARGTLYYHFESKEAIMDAIIERSAHDIVAEAERIVLQQELSVHEKIFSLFSVMNMEHLSGGDLMVDYLNRPQNALFHEKSNRLLLQKITPIFEKIIQEGVEKGIFENAYPYETAELILAMIVGVLDLRDEKMSQEIIERKTESLLYNIERILGADQGSFASFKTLSLQKNEVD